MSILNKKSWISFTIIFQMVFFTHPIYAANVINKPLWVEDELIIKFVKGVQATNTNSLLRNMDIKTIHKYKIIDALHLKLPSNLSVNKAISALVNSPLVEYVEPNYLYYTNTTIPDDTRFDQQWGADNTGQRGGVFDADMDLPEAWDITTGSNEIVVAVIDSGTSLTHPDLIDNIWVNPGEIPGNGIDDDNNGYIDDIHGWDFTRNDNDPSPVGGACGGHGTHTAGTIAASGNNALGVSGVAWNVKIMPLNTFKSFLSVFCSTSDADLLKAIDYYTKMGVRISSNSYGGSSSSTVMKYAILRSKSIFIAAAGNDSKNNDTTPSYPANYALDNIISVAATDRDDLLASFSNFGNSVDVGAPGQEILSTIPGNTYAFFSGTSMATPNVAGIAALLLSQDANLTHREIKWRILNGTDLTNINVASQGRVNAFNSLQYGLTLPDVSVSISPISATTVPQGDTFTYSISLTNHSVSTKTASGTIYARAQNGLELIIEGPVNVTLSAGETISAEFMIDIPLNLPAQQIEIFISALTSTSLDESKTTITITN